MNFFENELKIHKIFCELVQIWLLDPYSKTPNTQLDIQNIFLVAAPLILGGWGEPKNFGPK